MPIIKEGRYGMMALAQDLESWANTNGLNFKKLSSEKKPGNYGSNISYLYYQIGDKYALLKYSTTPGAPRLNELRFYVLDQPNTAAKVLASVSFVEDFSYIRAALEKAGLKTSANIETWNKIKIAQLVKDLRKEKSINQFTDAQAFDMSNSILSDNPGLEDSIRKNYGVKDVVGWLANAI